MIAPHLRESAGHLQSQIDALQEAVNQRQAILDQQETYLAPIRQSLDKLLARIANLQTALETLRAASPAPSLVKRLSSILGIDAPRSALDVPAMEDLPGTPSAPEGAPPTVPPFAETVIRLDELRGPSEREKALAARGE